MRGHASRPGWFDEAGGCQHVSRAGAEQRSGAIKWRRSGRSRTVTREASRPERRVGEGAQYEELIVNGVFAMDSRRSLQRARLADLAPSGRAGGAVGGLGLGFTAAAFWPRTAATDRRRGARALLVDWARRGLTPSLARAAVVPVGAPARSRRATTCPRAGASTSAGPVGRDRAGRRQRPGLPDPPALTRPLRPSADLRRRRLVPGRHAAIWCQGRAPGWRDTLGRPGRRPAFGHRAPR